MKVYELMLQRRSIRKFKPDLIPQDILEKAVNVARLAPCGANIQSLKFAVVKHPDQVKGLFAYSKWGMHLPDGSAHPQDGEQPTAWILILHDQKIKARPLQMDIGIAGENIVLYALSEGIASCWILNIHCKKAAEFLNLPDNLEIQAAIALGYPAIEPKIVSISPDGDTKYYWDEDGTFCVPKRSLEEVMLVF